MHTVFPLSIIIPSYNRATLVDKTLQSLEKQSRSDFQVIIVDHGSTDNTEEVCGRYKASLHLSYYKITRDDERFAAAVPRVFGVARSESPFIAFLDTGMLLPSHYVDAHISFHEAHPDHVGIGLQHGLDLQFKGGHAAYTGIRLQQHEDSGEAIASFLNSTEDIEQAFSILKDAQLRDRREGIDLQKSKLPWFNGWTANLSMPREAYHRAGGFDVELKGWGFEDVDLCYRLSRLGLKFAFVENGWGIELPQPRKPMRDRLKTHLQNVIQCYTKQKSLALETLVLREILLHKTAAAYVALHKGDEDRARATIHDSMRYQFLQDADDIFCDLAAIAQTTATFPSVILPDEIRSQFTQPTLFIGGTPREIEHYDYVTLGDESFLSTSSLWSCCGIVLPLPDQVLGTVVVSDIWKKLDWAIQYPFGMRSLSLLEVLISEIARVAKQAIFIHSSSVSGVALEVLEKTCQAYNLPYQVVLFHDRDRSTPTTPSPVQRMTIKQQGTRFSAATCVPAEAPIQTMASELATTPTAE